MNALVPTGYRPKSITRIVATSIAPSSKVAHVSRAGERFTLVDVQGNKKPVGLMDQNSRIYLDLAVIDAAETKVRSWYQKSYSIENEGEAPDCSSDDNKVPSAQSKIPQSQSCALCPHNAWGSGKNGTGKACAEKHNLAVITVNEQVPMVFQFQVPPASLTSWGAYCSSLEKRGIDITDAITRVLFDPAQQGRLLFELAGQLQSPFVAQRDHAWANGLTFPAIRSDAPPAPAQQIAPPPPVQQIPAPAPAQFGATPTQLPPAGQVFTQSSPTVTAPAQGFAEPAKRTRRTKAQMEADNAAAAASQTGFGAAPVVAPSTGFSPPAAPPAPPAPPAPSGEEIPTFLQRNPPPPAAPAQGFGMQAAAPAPNAMQAAIAAAMALKNANG